MNETYYLKVSGKANIPKRLEIGHNYKVVMDASITQEQKNDNNDGTYDVIFKVEPLTVEIGKDGGEVIKAKDPRKNSVKIRNKLHWLWQNAQMNIEFDDYYTKVTNYITLNLEDIISEIK
jgi:hypothetical protein